jgi:hypothetical protein
MYSAVGISGCEPPQPQQFSRQDQHYQRVESSKQLVSGKHPQPILPSPSALADTLIRGDRKRLDVTGAYDVSPPRAFPTRMHAQLEHVRPFHF